MTDGAFMYSFSHNSWPSNHFQPKEALNSLLWNFKIESRRIIILISFRTFKTSTDDPSRNNVKKKKSERVASLVSERVRYRRLHLHSSAVEFDALSYWTVDISKWRRRICINEHTSLLSWIDYELGNSESQVTYASKVIKKDTPIDRNTFTFLLLFFPLIRRFHYRRNRYRLEVSWIP